MKLREFWFNIDDARTKQECEGRSDKWQPFVEYGAVDRAVSKFAANNETLRVSIDTGKDELRRMAALYEEQWKIVQKAEKEIVELKAKLYVANDSRLRTYDGLTDKADRCDKAEAKLAKAEKLINKLEAFIDDPENQSQLDCWDAIDAYSKGEV